MFNIFKPSDLVHLDYSSWSKDVYGNVIFHVHPDDSSYSTAVFQIRNILPTICPVFNILSIIDEPDREYLDINTTLPAEILEEIENVRFLDNLALEIYNITADVTSTLSFVLETLKLMRIWRDKMNRYGFGDYFQYQKLNNFLFDIESPRLIQILEGQETTEKLDKPEDIFTKICDFFSDYFMSIDIREENEEKKNKLISEYLLSDTGI